MGATVSLPLPSTSPTGFQAFSRSSTVTVGGVQIANVGAQRGLDVGFTVRRSLKANEPNTCDLRVFNLSDYTRKAITQASSRSSIVAAPPAGTPNVAGQPVDIIPVQIDAGYVGHTSTIFLGELASVPGRGGESTTDGADIVTEFSTGDGDTATQLQRINLSFPSGPSSAPLAVVKALLGQMGIGVGNLGAVTPLLNAAQGTLFAKGVVLKGNAADHLVDLCASVGLEFSVQNGGALFLPQGQPTAGQAYNFSPSSGLVGTPTVDSAGICSFVTFILPGIVPGAPVSIDSAFVQGDFRLLSCEYEGETFGNDWYVRCEAGRLGLAP